MLIEEEIPIIKNTTQILQEKNIFKEEEYENEMLNEQIIQKKNTL